MDALTVDQFKLALPDKVKKSVNQELIDQVNATLSEPEMFEAYRDNLLSYTKVMADGTASWSHYTATQFILGIRPQADGLVVDPCIPTSWTGFSVKRTFRGKKIEIDVINAPGVSKGIASLTVDGKSVEGNFVPAKLLKSGTKIVAQMG